MVARRGARHALYLAFVSAAARGPGFLIPLLIASFFGAGPRTDAYFLVYSAVLLIGGTIGQGVEVAIVPFAARALRETGGGLRPYLRRAARDVALVALLAWAVVLLIVAIGAQPGLRKGILVYAVAFIPLAGLWCAAGVYSGALVSQWKIAEASGSMLWRGAGGLVGLAFWPAGAGLVAVAVGLGMGEVCRFLWLQRRVTRTVPLNTSAMLPLNPFRQAAAAQVLAGAAGGVVPVVERLLAATLGPGTISHLEYATRLLVIPTLLFDGGLAPLLLARWSNQITTEGQVPARRDVMRAVGKGMALAAACAIPLTIFAPQFVLLLLRHGQFSFLDAAAVGALLRVLAVGFVASMGALLIERLFLARARNRTLAVASLLRAGTRLTLVFGLISSERLLAFGIGYAGAEAIYLLLLVFLVAQKEPPGPAARPISS